MANRQTISRDRLAELRGGGNPGDNGGSYDGYPPPPRQQYGQYQQDYQGYNSYPQNNQYSQQSYGQQDYGRQQQYGSYRPEEYEMGPPSGGGGGGRGGAGDMQSFFDEVEDIRSAIQTVNDNINHINELHNNSLDAVNRQQNEWVTQQLDSVLADTKRRNNHIKERIKKIELENAKLKNSGDVQIRKTQHAALKKRFMETIQRFQEIERQNQNKYKQRIERQYRIVNPNATPQEVEAVLDSDQGGQIFAQSVLQANRSGQARAALEEVQSRHDDIKKIEKTILELHQLFTEMSVLVEQQEDMVNNIEQHAMTTATHMEEGGRQVTQAVESARKARAKRWWCFGIIVVIIIAVILVVLATTTKLFQGGQK
ncbi:uncharacterized protein VTP21DRAFT_8288 [Calcarisporiella thermophila]|uniref:uncharacterized protein n=1 Tax=Calcarisporiella thermophila TaxID=911321 RepID=UPI0037443104